MTEPSASFVTNLHHTLEAVILSPAVAVVSTTKSHLPEQRSVIYRMLRFSNTRGAFVYLLSSTPPRARYPITPPPFSNPSHTSLLCYI